MGAFFMALKSRAGGTAKKEHCHFTYTARTVSAT
jgi:hypothetical protein